MAPKSMALGWPVKDRQRVSAQFAACYQQMTVTAHPSAKGRIYGKSARLSMSGFAPT
jgi:hypothetical protein